MFFNESSKSCHNQSTINKNCINDETCQKAFGLECINEICM